MIPSGVSPEIFVMDSRSEILTRILPVIHAKTVSKTPDWIPHGICTEISYVIIPFPKGIKIASPISGRSSSGRKKEI